MAKKKVKLSFKPQQSTKKLIKDLKDREQYIIKHRYGLEKPEKRTLESIGREYGITRERVRQIQEAALKAIKRSKTYEEARKIFEEIEQIMHELGGIVAEHHFLSYLSDDKLTQNHIHFHLVIGPRFKKHKEDDHFHTRWSVNQEIAEKVHDALKRLHTNLSEEEILAEEEMILRFLDAIDGVEDGKIDEEVAKNFLKLSKQLKPNPLGDWGLARSKNISVRGVRDYAYLIMKKNGSPMHFREVAEAITKTFGKKAHPATTHNELIKDDRFVLVGRGMYGLREWGYREGVVKDVIAQIICEKGPLTKQEIIDAVLKERYLKENTIIVNISNKEYFKRLEDGRYDVTPKIRKKFCDKKKEK